MKNLFLLFIFLLSVIASFSLKAKTLALIIGINKYESASQFSDLKGAVNDANLIYNTFIKIGIPKKNLVKLTNQKATKNRIEAVWSNMIAHSKPGDTLIFTFAGHGTQEEDINGDEKLIDPRDTLDETLLLSGFADSPKKANNERLVDDELYTLWQRAKGRRIIFVADSCHSGGATRSADFRSKKYAWKTRFAPPSTVDLTPPTITDSNLSIEEGTLDNYFLFAASESRKSSLEGLIEGDYHGALSWAFAKGIEHAMLEKKSVISFSDLKDYVEHEVVIQTDNKQFTDIHPRGGGNDVLFKLNNNKPIAKQKKSEQTLVQFNIRGKQPDWLHNLHNVKIGSAAPDFIWDISSGDILNKQGDITAVKINNRDKLSQVISRVRILRVINQLARDHYIKSQFAGDYVGAKIHHFSNCTVCANCQNQCIVFSIKNWDENKSFLYQFNIAGNGVIQCFDPEAVRGNQKKYEFNATPPAGNDTLVSILLPASLAPLDNLITKKQCANTETIINKLPPILKNQDYQLGRIDIFTGK